MRLPTRQEINLFNSLDEQQACRNFLGKSLDEAESLFRQNALGYSDDLRWMGISAFRFYVIAYFQYLQSLEAEGDSDGVSCLVGVLEFRLEGEREGLLPIAKQVVEICRYIISNYSRFDILPDIYGDLRPRCEKLVQQLTSNP